MATIKKQTEIQSPCIYRVEEKVTGKCLGYLVKSDSQATPAVFYEVTWDNERMSWVCTCPSRVSCKHSRAVREYALSRYQHDHKSAARQRFEAERKEVLPTDQKGHLHSASGFALLK